MDIKTVAGGLERCRFGFFRLWRYEEELSVKKFERERERMVRVFLERKLLDTYSEYRMTDLPL